MKKKTLYIIVSILTILSLVGFVLSAVLIGYNTKLWWTMLIAGILFVAMFVLLGFVYFPNAEFICKKCNKQFKPTVCASMLGIHTLTKRYLRCPHCKEKSWCKETWNIK